MLSYPFTRYSGAKCENRNLESYQMKRSITGRAASVAVQRTSMRTTSSSDAAEVVGAATPVDVALVWKYTTAATTTATATSSHLGSIQNESYIHVSLQPKTCAISNSNNETEAPTTVSNQSNDKAENDTHSSYITDNEVIPEAVLIYERQIRKAQHARKTCQPISENDLNVIFVDDHMVVINKPAGILTVPGLNNNPSILDLVYNKYGVKTVTDPVHMIVHRLDMDTSGIVVFARTLSVAKQLHAIFRNRLHITKQYECLVMGHLRIPPTSLNRTNTTSITNINKGDFVHPSKILIDLPLQRDHVHPPFMRISTPQSEKAAMECVDQLQLHGWKKIMRKAAKPSQSIVLRIVEHGMYKNNHYNNNDHQGTDTTTQHSQHQPPSLPYTRLRLEPITGRTHQLRVHCAAIGYPIVGDPTYSLYGEAAMFGGLENLPSYVMNSDEKEEDVVVDVDNDYAARHVSNAAARTSMASEVRSPTEVATKMLSRCSMDVMKAWNLEYPPNIQPMCLHAAYLKLPHPLTGEICEWNAPASF